MTKGEITKEKIIELLSRGPMTRLDLGKKLKMSVNATQRHLDCLKSSGVIYIFAWRKESESARRHSAVFALGNGVDAKNPETKKLLKPVIEYSNGWNKIWKTFRHPHDVAFFGKP